MSKELEGPFTVHLVPGAFGLFKSTFDHYVVRDSNGRQVAVCITGFEANVIAQQYNLGMLAEQTVPEKGEQ